MLRDVSTLLIINPLNRMPLVVCIMSTAYMLLAINDHKMVISRQGVLRRPASTVENPSVIASTSPQEPAPASISTSPAPLPTSPPPHPLALSSPAHIPTTPPPPHHPAGPVLAPPSSRRRRSPEEEAEEDENRSTDESVRQAKIPKEGDAVRAETLMPDALTCPVCYMRHVSSWMCIDLFGIPSEMVMIR